MMMMTGGGMSVSNNFAGKKKSNRIVDLSSWGEKGLITGVRVLWSNFIVGVEFLFNGQTSGVVKGSINQFWEESFNLQKGDFIASIYGRAGENIECFGIKTAKGFTKTWGNPLGGEAFTFALNGYYIKALRLEAMDYINYMEPVYENEMFVYAQRLPFSSNGKFTTALGKRANNSEEFDDWDWLSNKFNYQIAEVKIWHNGSHVYGVQFHYNLDGTRKTPGKHCADVSGLRTESLVLNEGEHITKVLVRAGEWIDSITLITDQGRTVTAGGNTGTLYLTVVPEGHHFVAVGGATGNHLDTLTLFYDEIY